MPFNQLDEGARSTANIGIYNDVAENHTINLHHTSNDPILKKLNPIKASGYFVQPCMKGTREDIFEKIDTWLDDRDAEKNILLIRGGPGAGKSAIASSLHWKLRTSRDLVGFFAFRRADSALNNPVSLWQTIAYRFAQSDTGIGCCIIKALGNGQIDPLMPDIGDHFEALIKEPLMYSSKSMSLVIIVDALDECGESSHDVQRQALLETLTSWPDLPKTCG